METPVLFCSGLYSPLEGGSVAAEWRDYIFGLDALGRPVGLLEPLAPPFGRAWRRALARTDRFPAPRHAPYALAALVARRRNIRGDLMSAREARRLALLRRWRRLGTPRRVVAFVDFYDAARWSGALWKRVVEARIRTAFPSCRHIDWIARAVCETTALPREILAEARAFDAVWVPSDLQLHAFRHCGVPLLKIPEAVDIDHFRPRPRRVPRRWPRTFAFLTLSGFLPGRRSTQFSEVRKASDLTIEAFVREFGPDEPVCLLVKGVEDARRMKARVLEVLRDIGAPRERLEQIVILGEVTHAELAELYASVDAVVLASRGEGWGRPLIEAMAVGTPVIGTRYGGALEFMGDRTAWLVDCRLEDVVRRVPGYRAWGQWAAPDVAHLQRILRAIHTHPEKARARVARGGAIVRRRFSREAVARRMLRALERLGPRVTMES
jgi:glycosyltransferase involved in cell wall biosynthesis